MAEFNVTGPADKVSKLISEFNLGGRIVTDVFPCAPDVRDLNVRIEEDQVDDFVDRAEELGLSCKLI